MVQYSDNVAVDASDIGTGDIRVTGPNGFDQTASFISVSSSSDGTPRTGTYRITAPFGTWDSGNNGPYSIVMNSNQVSDTSSNFVSSGIIGSFSVSFQTPPQAGPVVIIDDGDPGFSAPGFRRATNGGHEGDYQYGGVGIGSGAGCGTGFAIRF
jgi:hypothetical protein